MNFSFSTTTESKYNSVPKFYSSTLFTRILMRMTHPTTIAANYLIAAENDVYDKQKLLYCRVKVRFGSKTNILVPFIVYQRETLFFEAASC